MSTTGNDDPPDEKTATVIPWPGQRVTPVETDADAAPPEADGLELADRATVDAFEAAVRRAVQEKLAPQPQGPDAPRFPPRGPDDLIAQMYSALSGKEPSEALDEVRQQLAARVAAAEEAGGQGADIIDLAAARAARQQAANETQGKVGGALRDTFNQFIGAMSSLNGGRGEVVLDSTFFKQHGPQLLGSLFQGLATALLKKDTVVVPPSESSTTASEPANVVEGAPTDGESAADASPRPEPVAAMPQPQVHVKVDFASIISNLFFRRREPTPPAPTTPTETTPTPPDEG